MFLYSPPPSWISCLQKLSYSCLYSRYISQYRLLTPETLLASVNYCRYIPPAGKTKWNWKESHLPYVNLVMFEGRSQMFKIFWFLIVSTFIPYYLSLVYIMWPKRNLLFSLGFCNGGKGSLWKIWHIQTYSPSKTACHQHHTNN